MIVAARLIGRCATGVAAWAVLATSGASSESMVLVNGTIYTANDAAPRATAVVVVGGRISYVGDSINAVARAPADAIKIDLAGRTVLPGFTDAHAHLAGIGFRELNFNLEGTTGIADLQQKLRERAASSPTTGWITGRGWIESHWTPAAFPSKADLDAAVADRPVLLTRADGHAAVANSFALKVAHIDATTPDPSGGQVLRDSRGEPTGMLVDNAIDLVRHLVPAPPATEVRRALDVGAQREIRLGWTQVHIAGNNDEEVAQIRQLFAEGKMKLRIYDALYGPSADVARLLEKGPSIDEADGRFTLRAAKFYIDGALGSRGAALLEPYADSAGSRGLLVNSEDVLLGLLIRALRSGIQIETHAIGDRGNRIMLDLYEKAFRAVPPSERGVAEPRWRIEHAQVLAPTDIPRFAQLGVIPSMQPSHAIGDLSFAPARLGHDRLAGAYAWRSLIDAGSIIPGGSDAPVERGEPMIEFYAAVARRSLDGFSNDDWHRELRVTRMEALKMFTLWPAFAAFQEKERGSIEIGKQGDFTVLSADIMTIPEREILQTRCTMTIIAGEVVHREN